MCIAGQITLIWLSNEMDGTGWSLGSHVDFIRLNFDICHNLWEDNCGFIRVIKMAHGRAEAKMLIPSGSKWNSLTRPRLPLLWYDYYQFLNVGIYKYINSGDRGEWKVANCFRIQRQRSTASQQCMYADADKDQKHIHFQRPPRFDCWLEGVHMHVQSVIHSEIAFKVIRSEN